MTGAGASAGLRHGLYGLQPRGLHWLRGPPEIKLFYANPGISGLNFQCCIKVVYLWGEKYKFENPPWPQKRKAQRNILRCGGPLT